MSGHILGGLVTVTDGDCRLYFYNYEPVITQQYLSDIGKSDLRVVYLHELMSCLCPPNEAAIL
jgi:hypothetical protein